MSKMSKQPEIKLEKGFDPSAERTVIGTLLKYGIDVFYDIDYVVNENSFFLGENKFLYANIRKLLLEDKLTKPTISAVVAKCNSTDENLSTRYQIFDYASALLEIAVPITEVAPFCNTVQKFYLIRGLQERLLSAAQRLSNADGSLPLAEIINSAEKPITEFTGSLINDDETLKLGDQLNDYLTFLQEVKPEIRGIPTGYPTYDKWVGGGLRRPGVHLIGGRSKAGKSFMAMNIARNVSSLGIPVLYLDTELTKEMVMERLSALISGIETQKIEKGNFEKTTITSVASAKCNKHFYYHNISGKLHTEWISIIRRWIMKEVGFHENGTTKDCLIVLDYIKSMNLKDMGNFAEYQYLGQVITDLHNFCIEYNVSMLSMAQLNRDGIGKEDQSVIAASDRLISLCSSFSILKQKTAEDFAADPPQNGDRKLVVVCTRFGSSGPDGEYINLKTDLSRAYIVENGTNRNIPSGSKVVLEKKNDEDNDIDI